MGKGVVRLDQLSAAGGARIAGDRIPRWRRKHTAKRAPYCQSGFPATERSGCSRAQQRGSTHNMAAQSVARRSGCSEYRDRFYHVNRIAAGRVCASGHVPGQWVRLEQDGGGAAMQGKARYGQLKTWELDRCAARTLGSCSRRTGRPGEVRSATLVEGVASCAIPSVHHPGPRNERRARRARRACVLLDAARRAVHGDVDGQRRVSCQRCGRICGDRHVRLAQGQGQGRWECASAASSRLSRQREDRIYTVSFATIPIDTWCNLSDSTRDCAGDSLLPGFTFPSKVASRQPSLPASRRRALLIGISRLAPRTTHHAPRTYASA